MKKDESTGMRLIRFKGKLNEILKAVGIDIVVYEFALHMHGPNMKRAGANVQSEIQGVLKLWCEENGIEYKGYSPTEIKKHATGKGNAKKPEMIAAAQKKFRRVFESDDEADAVWLLDYARKDLEC